MQKLTVPITLTTPDWLAQHGGELRPGLGDHTWVVLFSGQPQYRLDAIPAEGRCTCAIVEAVSGRRVDEGKEYSTPTDALRGGLDELRVKLGW
jgi:hypothetical protein